MSFGLILQSFSGFRSGCFRGFRSVAVGVSGGWEGWQKRGDEEGAHPQRINPNGIRAAQFEVKI